jgi:Holliday junction resolvase RusA-like endonuclease
MSSVRFFVPGQPVGKGRARIGRVGKHARMFTPEKTVSYENSVRHAGHVAMNGAAPLLGAIAARLAIVLQIPASWSEKKQAQAEAGTILPKTKPDIDNVEKAVFDALNGVAWRDDVQIVDVSKSKRYGRTPGVTVEFEEIKEQE